MDHFNSLDANSTRRQHAVILLHGMGRTRRSFNKLARQLYGQGYIVANIGYASLSEPLETHARRVTKTIDGLAQQGVREISFVAHSLGGLVVRRLMSETLPLPVSRIVFLGTPNKGAQLAGFLSRFSLYRLIFGPSGLEVLAETADHLPLPAVPVAVIAGGNGGRGYNPLLRGDNDGVVAVDETRLDGRERFLRIACLHTFLPCNEAAIRAVQQFLAIGRMGNAA